MSSHDGVEGGGGLTIKQKASPRLSSNRDTQRGPQAPKAWAIMLFSCSLLAGLHISTVLVSLRLPSTGKRGGQNGAAAVPPPHHHAYPEVVRSRPQQKHGIVPYLASYQLSQVPLRVAKGDGQILHILWCVPWWGTSGSRPGAMWDRAVRSVPFGNLYVNPNVKSANQV